MLFLIFFINLWVPTHGMEQVQHIVHDYTDQYNIRQLTQTIAPIAHTVKSISLKGCNLKDSDRVDIRYIVEQCKHLQYFDITENTDIICPKERPNDEAAVKFLEQLHSPYLKGMLCDTFMIQDKEYRHYCDFLGALRYHGEGHDLIKDFLDAEGNINQMTYGFRIQPLLSSFKILDTYHKLHPETKKNL